MLWFVRGIAGLKREGALLARCQCSRGLGCCGAYPLVLLGEHGVGADSRHAGKVDRVGALQSVRCGEMPGVVGDVLGQLDRPLYPVRLLGPLCASRHLHHDSVRRLLPVTSSGSPAVVRAAGRSAVLRQLGHVRRFWTLDSEDKRGVIDRP